MNYLVTSQSAMFFECNYSCDNGIFLFLDGRKYFITDGRYTTEARERIEDKAIDIIESFDIFKKAKALIIKSKIKSITIDPTEISLNDFNKINLPIYFKKKVRFSQLKRIKKRDYEIELIRKSLQINKIHFDTFASFLKSHGLGLDENSIYHNSKQILEDFGKYKLSFDPIVAIDQNIAKPHSLPSSTKILRKDSVLLFDAGIKYENYCSDRSRTAFICEEFEFSKTQKFKNQKHQEIYDLVLHAQENAIYNLKAGMSGKDVDALARDVIERGGYGKFFIHSTGHGIGLDIHELPIISKNSQMKIEDGMVFSIEPGIYIPNEIGVRIEDIVVVKNGVAKILE